MSAQFGATEAPLTGFRILQLGLSPDRAQLYQRINLRCARMFEQGLRQEVEALLALGYSEQTKALESIGYRQMLDHLAGRCTEAEALESTRLQTRRYAKRQWTWFRRDPSIHWLHGFGDDPEIVRKSLERVEQHTKA